MENMKDGDDNLSTRTETNASSSSTTTTTSTSNSRDPKCAGCRNHGYIIRVKGHKNYCRYRNCVCKMCKLTLEKRRVTADQQALKRAQVLAKSKVKVPGEVDPEPESFLLASTSPRDSPVSNHSSNGVHTDIGGLISIPTSAKLPPLQPHSGSTNHLPQSQSGENVEILLAYSTKLLELFQYPWASLSLIYVILKLVNGNPEEAVRRISEGTNDIRAMHFWKEVKMIQSGLTYCCPGYTGLTGIPTYDGQVPYIGVAPLSNTISLRSCHPSNSHLPSTRVPSSSDSPLEHSDT